jgi:hypothetical protein
MTTLLPDAISLQRVRELNSRPRYTGPKRMWPEGVGNQIVALRSGRMDETTVEKLFPFRTKNDKNIRRTRFKDVRILYSRTNRQHELLQLLLQLAGYDYIFVMNVCYSNLILSHDNWNWYEFWNSLGAFDGDLSHYAAVSKHINNYYKTFPDLVKPDIWLRTIESSTMSGYRNVPYPNFDVYEETRLLAEGGMKKHGEQFGGIKVFKEIALDELAVSPAALKRYYNLTDFIYSGIWKTSGSSDLAKVEYTIEDDNKGSFKARKNMVLDLVSVNQLVLETLSRADQRNKSIVKSELGKLRIAVKSPDWLFFALSWFDYLTGKQYLKWPYTQGGEKVQEQYAEMIGFMRMMKGRWSLPYDYDGFDHQPTTAELKVLLDILVAMARINVKREDVSMFDKLASNVRDSFDHSTLEAYGDRGPVIYRVVGGLMSGLRWTSVFGQAWNIVMTSWGRRIMNMSVDKDKITAIMLKGDDSTIISETYYQALYMKMSYDALGALGGEGKFGIHYQFSEFLRLAYTPKLIRGYPTRIIPGLTQRKPWNSQPWSSENTIESVINNLWTVLRRLRMDLLEAGDYERGLAFSWSQLRGVTSNWLKVPKVLGGLGVLPWDIPFVPGAPWPKLPDAFFHVDNLHEERIAREVILAQGEGFSLSISEAEKVVQEMFFSKVVADDVVSLSGEIRQRWKQKEIPVFKYESVNDSCFPMLAKAQEVSSMLTAFKYDQPNAYSGMLNALRRNASEDWRRVKSKLEKVKPYLRLRGISIAKYASEKEHDFYVKLRKLERSGMTRGEAMDWMFFEGGGIVRHRLSSMVSKLVKFLSFYVLRFFVDRYTWHQYRYTWAMSQVSLVFVRALATSSTVSAVFSW